MIDKRLKKLLCISFLHSSSFLRRLLHFIHHYFITSSFSHRSFVLLYSIRHSSFIHSFRIMDIIHLHSWLSIYSFTIHPSSYPTTTPVLGSCRPDKTSRWSESFCEKKSVKTVHDRQWICSKNQYWDEWEDGFFVCVYENNLRSSTSSHFTVGFFNPHYGYVINVINIASERLKNSRDDR